MENKIIIAYCLYCKAPIYEEDDFYIESDNIFDEEDEEITNIYHVECWELLNETDDNN